MALTARIRAASLVARKLFFSVPWRVFLFVPGPSALSASDGFFGDPQASGFGILFRHCCCLFSVSTFVLCIVCSGRDRSPTYVVSSLTLLLWCRRACLCAHLLRTRLSSEKTRDSSFHIVYFLGSAVKEPHFFSCLV